MLFGIGMQTSARHAPCGFTSNPFTRGRSRVLIHSLEASLESRRILVSGVARSSNSTVAVGVAAGALIIPGPIDAAPTRRRKDRRSMALYRNTGHGSPTVATNPHTIR